MLNRRMFLLLVLVLKLSMHLIMTAPTALKHAVCGEEHAKVGGPFVCLAYFPRWSYNAEQNACVEFIYGGCNGNNNNFETQDECETMCKF